MSDLLRLALEAETKPFPLRADDTPEVQAERRRVLLEAMASDLTQCPVCAKTVKVVRRSNTVGAHQARLRRCSGRGMPVRVRLVPSPAERMPAARSVGAA
jgi:hypothetical protein